MPSDLRVEKIRLVTGSMEYTISAVTISNPNGVVTEPSGSIIRSQDGRVWVNQNGGTVWALAGHNVNGILVSGSITGTLDITVARDANVGGNLFIAGGAVLGDSNTTDQHQIRGNVYITGSAAGKAGLYVAAGGMGAPYASMMVNTQGSYGSYAIGRSQGVPDGYVAVAGSANQYQVGTQAGDTIILATGSLHLAAGNVDDGGSADIVIQKDGVTRFSGPIIQVTGSVDVRGSITGSGFTGSTFIGVAFTGSAYQVAGSAGRLKIGHQVFTAGGTYTPTQGTRAVRIRLVGGGGGGGGISGGASVAAAGGGGGAGGYLETWIDPGVAITGGAVTIGSSGVGGTNSGGNGGSGGSTSIIIQGTSYGVGGGDGGVGMLAGSSFATVDGGAGGTAAIVSVDITHVGQPGVGGLRLNSSTALGGNGGSSPFGGGGRAKINSVFAGSGYGAGGAGACSTNGTALAGGAGTPGIVIVEEYA
jgi:hypothetical protein